MRADRKQREFELRESDILAAALELCSGPQWESVSVEQIAFRADVAKGTVYNHFTSKDELLFRLTMVFYQGLLAELRSLGDQGDPVAGFRRIIDRSLRYHLDHREYRYVVEYCSRIDFKERADDKLKEECRRLDAAFSEWGTGLIRAGMEAEVFARRDVDQVMLALHACYEGAITMLWAGEQWFAFNNAETLIHSVTEFMIAGLIGQQAIAAPARKTRNKLRDVKAQAGIKAPARKERAGGKTGK